MPPPSLNGLYMFGMAVHCSPAASPPRRQLRAWNGLNGLTCRFMGWSGYTFHITGWIVGEDEDDYVARENLLWQYLNNPVGTFWFSDSEGRMYPYSYLEDFDPING